MKDIAGVIGVAVFVLIYLTLMALALYPGRTRISSRKKGAERLP